METRKISVILLLVIALLLSLSGISVAAPLGTAFTYQGRLIDSNSVADGLYDFQFSLHDANTAGSQLAGDVNEPDVDVIDGYFTVELDFGGGVFDGNAVWLETGVRPGELEDPNTYTVLTPRQEVTPTPYALQSKTVSVPLTLIAEAPNLTAVLSVSSTGDGVAIFGQGKNGDFGILGLPDIGVYGEGGSGLAGKFDGNVNMTNDLTVGGTVNATAFAGDGSGLTNLPAIAETDPTVPANVKDGIDWLEVTSRPAGLDDGDDVGITSESDPQVGTISSNYVPKWNGSALVTGTIYDNGNVGIGTTSPLAKLSVGGIGIADAAIGGQGTAYGVYGYGSDSLGVGVHGVGSYAGVFGIDADGGSWGQLGYDTYGGYFVGDGYFSGDVGIGTAIPSTKLDVVGTVNATAFTGDGSGLTGVASDSDWTINGTDMYTNAGVTGNVGVGTASPTAKLHIGGTPGVDGIKFPDGTLQTTSAADLIASLEARIAELENPPGWWYKPLLIETDSAGHAVNPQVAIDPSGNAVAVWWQDDGTRYNIWSNRYVPGTGWGVAELIETDDLGNAYYPQVAVDGSGNAVAVWYQGDETRNNIWSNRYVAGTGLWSTAVMIETDNAGGAYFPQVAVDGSGNAIAVWYQHDGTRENIYSNRYVAATGLWGTAELIEEIDTGHAANQQVAVDPNGNAVAVWRQSIGTLRNIWSNHYVEATGLWSGPVLIETDNAGNAFDPQVAVDDSGNAVAVWRQHDGTRENIYSNRYVAATDSWFGAELIETNNSGIFAPQVAVDPSGNAIVVWTQSDGNANSIWSNRYVPGTGWGRAELIEADSAGHADNPQVAMNPSGNAVAVWEQSNGNFNDICTNRYVVGTGWGIVEQIKTNNLRPADNPQVAMDPSGNAVAVWQQSNGTFRDIWSNRYKNE